MGQFLTGIGFLAFGLLIGGVGVATAGIGIGIPMIPIGIYLVIRAFRAFSAETDIDSESNNSSTAQKEPIPVFESTRFGGTLLGIL
jgi:hypothetical protein